ncbi:MAG: hypothetical protein K6E51_03425 [Treponema sp.]|nr:hypothetical protein [Treponema sp.]
MSDFNQQKHNTAIYEPGTLDHTRKNIGAINEEEAKRMTKILGGQIFTEKSTPINTANLPKPPIKHHVKGSTPKTQESRSTSSHTSSSASTTSSSISKGISLPSLNPKTEMNIDRLMMSYEYGIKPNYGLFNFVKKFQKNGYDRVSPDFVSTTLSRHIDHLQAFITLITSLIELAPKMYKNKIQKDDDLKFRFLRRISSWSVRQLKVLYLDIANNAGNTSIADLIPFIREIYGMLIQIYYLGLTKVSQTLKDVYTDQIQYPEADKKKVGSLARQCVSEWGYLYNEVIKGLYPLLMRMTSTTYQVFPNFFTTNAKQILSFLNKNKFDLILEDREVEDAEKTIDKIASVEEPKEEEEEKKKEESKNGSLTNMELVKAGLSLLNTLFPEAGFNKLDKYPDLYPYFQPMFDFDDGFNLLDPENPLQTTIVLIRIIEDLFHGCRNINFTEDGATSSTADKKGDKISSVMNDWSIYQEFLFEKSYAKTLVDFVNELYSQSDFAYSQFGKKTLNNLLWHTRFHYLPLFKFEKLTLERPNRDNSHIPLYFRTRFMVEAFNEIAKDIDRAAKSKAPLTSMTNPWDHYRFDIANPISERLDVLLAAKRYGENMTATNANLVKYTLCIIAVLDWWINDPNSPAYQANPMKIYRISPSDNTPVFSVPVREDQKKLFANNLKAMAQKKLAQNKATN